MKTPATSKCLSSEVSFVAGLGPIFREPAAGSLRTGALDGGKHFALWPLAQAAESCCGADQWSDSLLVPQAWLQFDAADPEAATAEWKAQGYQLLVAPR
jgi:hypothetical protein